jgi:CDP-diacylglycerol--glycerol-3-phosphate 3-phosphatidyltransferase
MQQAAKLDKGTGAFHTWLMTLADKVTSLRLVLAPVFFVIYLLPRLIPDWFGQGSAWTVPVLWALFIVSEITDMIDGMIARKRKEVGDFGKLYDPFADTLVQLTYFLCFVIDGILPVVLLLVVLYREFCILFLRNLMLKKGAAMGARLGGKIKTVTYITAGALALLASSAVRLGLDPVFYRFLSRAAAVVFAVSVVFAVLSFADYLRVYKKA